MKKIITGLSSSHILVVKGDNITSKIKKKEGFAMQLFKGCREDGCKDNTILWFIILFVLLFFCGGCGETRNTGNCCCD